MLRLPVCPYCNAVYRYNDILNISAKKSDCYHCGREFEISKTKGRVILMLSVCCLLIAFDIFMLYSSKDINISTIMIMAITDAVFITAAVCLFPFTVKFRGIKMTKSEKQKLRNTKK